MSNNKQSSVDWVIDEIIKHQMTFYGTSSIPLRIIKKGKSKHKEEIERAHYDGSVIVISKPDDDMLQLSQQYYNETFGGNK
jgi:hypothetical protein